MTTTDQKPGCLSSILGWLGLRPKKPPSAGLPYHLRDDFLSPAELSFHLVLRQSVASWAEICPKVSLGDLFFARTGNYGQNRSWMNRINRRHVDFLLCSPQTMQPLLGIELDDSSHNRARQQESSRTTKLPVGARHFPWLFQAD